MVYIFYVICEANGLSMECFQSKHPLGPTALLPKISVQELRSRYSAILSKEVKRGICRGQLHNAFQIQRKFIHHANVLLQIGIKGQYSKY